MDLGASDCRETLEYGRWRHVGHSQPRSRFSRVAWLVNGIRLDTEDVLQKEVREVGVEDSVDFRDSTGNAISNSFHLDERREGESHAQTSEALGWDHDMQIFAKVPEGVGGRLGQYSRNSTRSRIAG